MQIIVITFMESRETFDRESRLSVVAPSSDGFVILCGIPWITCFSLAQPQISYSLEVLKCLMMIR